MTPLLFHSDLQCNRILCVLASTLSLHHWLSALGLEAFNRTVMAQVCVSDPLT